MSDNPKPIVPLLRWRVGLEAATGAFVHQQADNGEWVKAEAADAVVTAYNKLKDIMTAFKADAEKSDNEHAAQVAELRGIVDTLRGDAERISNEKRVLQKRFTALDEQYAKLLIENVELYNWKVAHENNHEEKPAAPAELTREEVERAATGSEAGQAPS